MVEDNEEEFDWYYLTKNVIQSDKILNIPKRNWAEGIISSLLILVIISSIPFVRTIKLILSVVSVLVLMYINIVGIKERSITQIVVAELKFRKSRRKLHLRSPEYVKKNFKGKESETADESYAQFLIKNVKGFISRFVEENS